MDTIKQLGRWIKIALVWAVYSSKDAKKISLAVKGAGMIYAAYLMQAIGIACQYGYQCEFNFELLTDAVNVIADIVFYSLTLAGVFGYAYGIARKLWLSLSGEHAGLNARL